MRIILILVPLQIMRQIQTKLIWFFCFRWSRMTSFIVKHLRTLAISSVALTSSYFLYNYDHDRSRTRLLSLLKVNASDYVSKNWFDFVLIIKYLSFSHIEMQEPQQVEIVSSNKRIKNLLTMTMMMMTTTMMTMMTKMININ